MKTYRNALMSSVVLVGVAMLPACSASPVPPPSATAVVIVDHSPSTSHYVNYAAEAGLAAAHAASAAIEHHDSTLVVLAAGANYADAAVVARGSLDAPCPNEKTCADNAQGVVTTFSRAASAVANSPLDHKGTDLVAALVVARQACGSGSCAVTVLTDGVDRRVLDPQATPEIAANGAAAAIGSLKDTSVHICGIGMDGSSSAEVLRINTFWNLALSQAHAASIRLERSC